MGQIIWTLIGALILLAGIVLIYDARIITKKMFGFGDQNEATTGFKILGALLSLVGFFIKKSERAVIKQLAQVFTERCPLQREG